MTVPHEAVPSVADTSRAEERSGFHLHPILASEIRSLRDSLTTQGVLRTEQQLQVYYDTFRRRFGPEVLRRLEGQELLERMHAHGNRESLVYWLEFKDDEEFPAIFGSISGGSALKFGVYRRSETGAWAIKGPSYAPQDIPIERAIEIAHRHRDQLLAAVDLVTGLRSDASDQEYATLQRSLASVAPDVEDTAWGHKYLALIAPHRLDDFHAEAYQRYHLIRVLQLPPRGPDGFLKGRYVCAGRFVALARELDLPLEAAGTLLNRLHGRPRNYWRIGTTDDERARRKYWPMMRDGNRVAIGWPAIGDLTGHGNDAESREAIRGLVAQHYPGVPQVVGRAAAQIFKFTVGLEVGDRVLASDGMAVLGVGEITGGYQFTAGDEFPHQRPVQWRSFLEWQTVDAEALRTTVGQIRDYRNQLEAERHILEDGESTRGSVPPPSRPVVVPINRVREPAVGAPIRHEPLPRLDGIPGRVQALLERKGQAILYGPPGTGKTHWAVRSARDLASLRVFGHRFDQLSEPERARVLVGSDTEPSLVRACTFHPEYGYEDFIEGFRPHTGDNGQLGFALRHGIFRSLCLDAARMPQLDFYLLIDEINRGDVPRIFGELLTLLERDKRGQRVSLPVSSDLFHVPTNVFVIGTMNTADRSIALLDVALRRRFGFVELMPDSALLGRAAIAGLPLGAWLDSLNQRIRSMGGGDARNRQVGHSFLLDHGKPITSVDQLVSALRDDIIPLLEEYCYDDFAQLADLVGSRLVDIPGQRVKPELFDPSQVGDLVAALMRPEIATAAASTVATPDGAEPRGPDDTDDADDDVTNASGQSGSVKPAT